MAVYANGMSIACKAADGKTVAAMPDVCLSPPTPPAGPVPLPYPNTAMASDTTKGSKTVQIGGQEVMLKNKSTFKKSTGDEAATKTLGMGVVSHQIQGEVNFCAWSMDVKFEGENVPRHLDLTLHNEMCNPANTPPWPYLEKMSASDATKCAKDKEKEETKCKEFKPYGEKDPCPPAPASPLFSKEAADKFASAVLKDREGASACLAARRCSLQPYEKTEKGKGGCCPGQTGHHLVEASAFHVEGRGDGTANLRTGNNVKLDGCSGYDLNKAPCICVEGAGHGVGTHGLMHTFQSAKAMKCKVGSISDSTGKLTRSTNKTTVKKAQKDAAKAVTETFPESGCNKDCIEAQLKAYHQAKPPHGAGLKANQQIKAVHTCKPDASRLASAEAEVAARKAKFDAIEAARAAVVAAE
ncbi:MAG TPA: PAAR-like domain-containing protein [Candidatus Sulfotelmatobacter sp.]|nr:PAAR-like domain-containing protein [Candidatus Sulfotelmatobacter sp.]